MFEWSPNEYDTAPWPLTESGEVASALGSVLESSGAISSNESEAPGDIASVIELAAVREQVAAQFETVAATAQSDESNHLLHSTGGELNDDAKVKPAATQHIRHAASPEKHETQPRFSVRPSTLADLDDIVEVDIRTFQSVYTDYDLSNGELRADMRQKYLQRFEKVGGEWMPVLLRDGKVVGFIGCCPTSKDPNEFASWEETTDNGTLETTYDPKGKNIYVVTLSVLPEGSAAKDMLFMDQMGKMLREGYEVAFFESRLPQFRPWLETQVADVDNLAPSQLQGLAEAYYAKRITRGNKQLPFDPLLRLYEQVGCKLGKLVPNAYQDAPSMNYGVVCTFDGDCFFDGSMLGPKLPDNRLTRWLFGFGMQKAARSLKLTNKLFK